MIAPDPFGESANCGVVLLMTEVEPLSKKQLRLDTAKNLVKG